MGHTPSSLHRHTPSLLVSVIGLQSVWKTVFKNFRSSYLKSLTHTLCSVPPILANLSLFNLLKRAKRLVKFPFSLIHEVSKFSKHWPGHWQSRTIDGTDTVTSLVVWWTFLSPHEVNWQWNFFYLFMFVFWSLFKFINHNFFFQKLCIYEICPLVI